METDILTPKDLFQKDVHYVIPPFQRPYVWSQEDQWGPFWEDIHNVAENYLEELELSDNCTIRAEQATSPHFLGAVVFRQILTTTRDIDQREVIDGQQRMTTLQLFLDALQQVCEQSDQPYFKRTARRLVKLVANDEELVGDYDFHIFKLWPTRSDSEAFKHAMDNDLTVRDFETSPIVRAHEFFSIAIKKWLEAGVGWTESKIDALEATVTKKLQLVVIDLDIQDDPNLIFETLNARGTPLEQSDLIKNFVLSGENAQEDELWGNLSDPWWRQEVRQGRLFRPRLDMLLNYWLAMRTGSEVSPLRVFDAFRDHLGSRQISSLMSQIREDLRNYCDFETMEGRDQTEKKFYYHIDTMQAGVITPVLLMLLSAETASRTQAYHAIESFLIRRMVCRQTTKDYNKIVLELCNLLTEKGTNQADKIVIDFLREQEANSREWPTDQAVRDALETSPLYRLLTRGRLRLVLEAIENRLRLSSMSELQTAPLGLTIEHLMPVGWQKEQWPLPDSISADEATYQRNTTIHTLGNLTLVNGRLNSSMSNDAWESKRSELQEHSLLFLNRELLSQTSWDEETIRARSRRLAGLVSEVWPGPSADWQFA